MSANRFGKRYFATRERLAELDAAIRQLANDIGITLPLPPELAAAHHCLDSPFVFLAVGEINAGKSSLLNALAASELCAVSTLPETKSVTIHHHQGVVETAPLHPLCSPQPSSQPFLRHFTLIDTPGLEARIEGLLPAIQSQIPRTDLIFCVFSAANPWSAPTWNWLDTLPLDALNRTVIVVQRCDERSPQDLPVILGHLADLAVKRLGRTLPMFTVSAREALNASPTPRHIPRPGGFGPLEEYIAGNVCLSHVRWQALNTLRIHTAQQLALLDEHIDFQHRQLIHHHQFIDAVEREIDAIRQQFVNHLPAHLHEVAEAFELQAVATSKELHAQLGAVRSWGRLLSGKSVAQHIEVAFCKRLSEAVTVVARQDAQAATAACTEHWNLLVPRIQTELGIHTVPTRPVAELLESASHTFVTRLQTSAQEAISKLRVKMPLEHDLRDRNRSLKSFLAATLIFLTAAGCFGALQVHLANVAFLATAACFLSGGFTAAWVSRSKVTDAFLNRLLDTCEHFARILQQDYLDALQAVFREYASNLNQVRDHLSKQKQAVGPKQQRWQQLFLILKAIEQDF